MAVLIIIEAVEIITVIVATVAVLPRICETYLDVEIGALAADPATRDMTVRELYAERSRVKGG